MSAMGMTSSVDCFKALHAVYSKRNRHYHSTLHIDAMLQHFDATSGLAVYPHEVELAIWFHDAVYRPFSSSNEKDSADWAKEFLVQNKFDDKGLEWVYQLIMATQHQGAVIENDEKLIVDIDLTILGAPSHVYDQFEQNVRKEYWLVPSLIYCKKRKQLLQGFLDQGSIYYLDYFKNKYEQNARDNIARAISVL